MFLAKLFSSLTLSQPVPTSTKFVRNFKYDKHAKFRSQLNHPPRIYKPDEDDLENMPDPEKQMWKEQRSLYKLEAKGIFPKQQRRDPLDGAPQLRGVVLKTLIKKPKKPNSANRKCVYIRLSNGKETTAHVPGIGHNLQEHSNVLVKYHRTRDVPGLRLKVIRGVYDCALVVKQRPLSKK